MRVFPILFLFPAVAAAQDAPRLIFPVDCALGETCMIQQTMDRDPGPGAQDFQCGPMSYDGHDGTDIRVADHAALQAGVSILAAAPGRVLAIRDTVPDTGFEDFPEGQDCGNGVLIDHGAGWQTQYCHLALGSVSVREGETVISGQHIGLMGYSGSTEFPHLEILVRHNGSHVDPFDPSEVSACGLGAQPLWAEPVPMAPGGILSIGFADAIPDYDAIQAGTAGADALTRDGEALVIWGYIHGARAGDVMTATITTPQGTDYHTEEIQLDRTQAELFRATGRRISDPIAPGTYTGHIELTRDGATIDRETTSITVR